MLRKNQFLNIYLNTISEDIKSQYSKFRDEKIQRLQQLSQQMYDIGDEMYDQLEQNNLIKYINIGFVERFKSKKRYSLNDNGFDRCNILFDGIENGIALLLGGVDRRNIFSSFIEPRKMTDNDDVNKLIEIAASASEKQTELSDEYHKLYDQKDIPISQYDTDDTGFTDILDQQIHLNDIIAFFYQGNIKFGVVINSDDGGIRVNTETSGKINTYVINSNIIKNSVINIDNLNVNFERFNHLRPSVEI